MSPEDGMSFRPDVDPVEVRPWSGSPPPGGADELTRSIGAMLVFVVLHTLVMVVAMIGTLAGWWV